MVQTQEKTACSFIPIVTSKSTARVYTWRNRVRSNGRNERLELLDAKVSRAVLRGRDGGNAILLPDTDIKDSEWIADLLHRGLLKASFIPPHPTRVLRELSRYRTTLIQERSQEVNRLQKTLEGANIKLAAVATDILGVSGREMINALIEGTTDAMVLAELARGLLRKKLPQLQEALLGRVQPHHQILLRHISWPTLISLIANWSSCWPRSRPTSPLLRRCVSF